MCANDPAAVLSLVSCNKVATATTKTCDSAGTVARNISFQGNTLSCITVNDAPGSVLTADDANDLLDVNLTIQGTRTLKPNGVLVQLHDQDGVPRDLSLEYENFFSASAHSLTQVVARKVFEIDLEDDYIVTFESKASQMLLNVPSSNTQVAPVSIQIKYPKLEVLYQKEFLPLDMVS
jgi:hypothetical protein